MALKEDLQKIMTYKSDKDLKLAELRAAAEKEVNDIAAGGPPLTAFEKEIIRTAFKGGAVFGVEKALSEGDWQCKDYGDGWITFPNREAAEKYQEETGALMRFRQNFPA